jgi:hypothetical protein
VFLRRTTRRHQTTVGLGERPLLASRYLEAAKCPNKPTLCPHLSSKIYNTAPRTTDSRPVTKADTPPSGQPLSRPNKPTLCPHLSSKIYNTAPRTTDSRPVTKADTPPSGQPLSRPVGRISCPTYHPVINLTSTPIQQGNLLVGGRYLYCHLSLGPIYKSLISF